MPSSHVTTPDDDNEEYEVVPTHMYQEHSDENPFCFDPTCPDCEDPDAIGKVNQQYQDGLLTADEATNIVNGRSL